MGTKQFLSLVSESLMTNSNNNNWMFRRCLKLAGVRERKVMRGLFLETTCPTQFGGDAAVSPQISPAQGRGSRL